MESFERHLIETYAERDPNLKRLWDQHQKFHNEIQRLERRNFRTSREEVRLKEMKLKKLNGVQKMLEIISAYKEPGNALAL